MNNKSHKPSDTSYLNEQPKDHIEEANEMVKNNWHERGELPPVGVECERKVGIKWIKTSIVAHHVDGVRAIHCDEGFEMGTLGYSAYPVFRPISTEREKVIEAAIKVSSGGLVKEMYSALYDAGMLVLPPKKSDTKD